MYVVLVNVCVFTWSVLYDVTVIILLLLSACFLFCVSPIENENNTLRKDQFDIFRRKARIRIAVSLLIILIFMRFSSAELWKPSALAVSALALLCLVQLRRNKRWTLCLTGLSGWLKPRQWFLQEFHQDTVCSRSLCRNAWSNLQSWTAGYNFCGGAESTAEEAFHAIVRV